MSLPSIGIDWIKAKIDTGARSSSLHAFDIEEFPRDDVQWVRFQVRPWQHSHDDITQVELPVHDRRDVRSSSGHAQRRVVVLLPVHIAGREIATEVTLSNRDEMGFRMLVGRQALRQGFTIDASRSFVGGKAPVAARRRNRGRSV